MPASLVIIKDSKFASKYYSLLNFNICGILNMNEFPSHGKGRMDGNNKWMIDLPRSSQN